MMDGDERHLTKSELFMEEQVFDLNDVLSLCDFSFFSRLHLYCVLYLFLTRFFFPYQWGLIPRMGKTRR
jgi:hypothetical protein